MERNTIDTYLQINGGFVRVEEVFVALPDARYIVGAIACCINGTEILKLKHYDLIDQLWAYITAGLSSLQKQRNYDTFFPDQPLRLSFEILTPKITKVTVGDESSEVDSVSLRSTLSRGGKAFFTEMRRLYPEASSTWDRYRRELDSLSA